MARGKTKKVVNNFTKGGKINNFRKHAPKNPFKGSPKRNRK